MTETRHRYIKPCPANGVLGEWSQYSISSTSYGGGVQYREQKCDSPPPKYGGKDCDGSIREKRYCGETKCLGKVQNFT